MRVYLIAAAMCVAALTGQVASAAAQEAAPQAAQPAAPSTAPEATPRSYNPGEMAPIYDPPVEAAPPTTAPRKRRAYAPPKAVAVAEAPKPVETVAAPLAEGPTLAYQLTIIRAEAAHLDVLHGKSGPFAQAIAAWKIKDWYHFAFAMATLLVGAIILAIVAVTVASVVQRRREAAR